MHNMYSILNESICQLKNEKILTYARNGTTIAVVGIGSNWDDKGSNAMLFEQYTDKVIEHFMCPSNVGSMPNADAQGMSGDPSCGDSLTVYLKVKDYVIEDISFQVFGCVAAIATSSMTTELVKGKSLEEAILLTEDDITKELGGLPENKLHCSVLGVTALKNAIENYYEKVSLNDSDENDN